jgi:hypothetical protein
VTAMATRHVVFTTMPAGLAVVAGSDMRSSIPVVLSRRRAAAASKSAGRDANVSNPASSAADYDPSAMRDSGARGFEPSVRMALLPQQLETPKLPRQVDSDPSRSMKTVRKLMTSGDTEGRSRELAILRRLPSRTATRRPSANLAAATERPPPLRCWAG